MALGRNVGMGGVRADPTDVQLAERFAAIQEARQKAAAENMAPPEPEVGVAPPEAVGGGTEEPAPQPKPQPKPAMPPPTPPPLGSGTFALPGSGGAAPFRTSAFLQNRFVSGGGQDVASQLVDPSRIGRVAGGSPLAPAGATGATPPLAEDEIRRIMAGVLGGR